jgi:hypothetical protein
MAESGSDGGSWSLRVGESSAGLPGDALLEPRIIVERRFCRRKCGAVIERGRGDLSCGVQRWTCRVATAVEGAMCSCGRCRRRLYFCAGTLVDEACRR